MPYLFFGGAMNQMVMGIQMYFWLMLIGILGIVISNVVFYVFFWAPLKPLHGLFTSYQRKENAAFTFDEHLNFVLKSEKKAKLIYNETIAEAKKAQPDWETSPSGLIGRVSTELIFDPFGWTDVTSEARKAIDNSVEIYNEAHQDGKDSIHTLLKFSRLLHDGAVSVPIEKNFRVSWLRIYSAFPQLRLKSAWAGYLRQLAQQLLDDKKSDFSNMGLWLLAFCALVDVMLMATGALGLI